jgi:RNA polymerase sigma-70 factor (ECF subfamily)
MTHDKASLSAHEHDLLGYARRLTRNEADARDLVQDTWLHSLEALEKMDPPPENLRAWLLVSMRNHWFNVLRHHKVRANARAELASREAFDAGLCESRVVYAQFVRAWDTLPPQAQSIATQCLLDGESQEDVSRQFGITANGVASSIHRTREQLRHAMFGA